MIAELYIVNYCHPDCTPLKNIMRLPKAQAFLLAQEMAVRHKNTTAFHRFADFGNYYPSRLKTDKLLYARFKELGGAPLQKHPLSFVLQGSDYLNDWFDCGIVTKIPLNRIPDESISFTYGDSMTVLKKYGTFTMLTKDMLLKTVADYGGDLKGFLANVEKHYRYIEVQVWDDACLNL